jgi:hypothetical protein
VPPNTFAYPTSQQTSRYVCPSSQYSLECANLALCGWRWTVSTCNWSMLLAHSTATPLHRYYSGIPKKHVKKNICPLHIHWFLLDINVANMKHLWKGIGLHIPDVRCSQRKQKNCTPLSARPSVVRVALPPLPAIWTPTLRLQQHALHILPIWPHSKQIL